jgi:hypothetical protein
MRAQPVATGRKWERPEDGSNRRIGNRWQPTAMAPERMVRRGSTVRVRQRAPEKPRKSGLFLSRDLALRVGCSGMEHFMELSEFRSEAGRGSHRRHAAAHLWVRWLGPDRRFAESVLGGSAISSIVLFVPPCAMREARLGRITRRNTGYIVALDMVNFRPTCGRELGEYWMKTTGGPTELQGRCRACWGRRRSYCLSLAYSGCC